LGIDKEYEELFKIWYGSKLLSTTKWLRFDVKTRLFDLKDREGFVIEDSGKRGTLEYKTSATERKLESFL